VVGVGVFSYSLYLVHNPVRAVVKQLLGPRAETSDPVEYLAFAAVMAAAGYLAATVCFRLVERHFLFEKGADRVPPPRVLVG
jgi:peptidoglycan/LPS O-acetylase OafA/YrhL